MEKYFGEKQERFSFRKLSVGLVSATISSLFFMSVLASSSVDAQETAGVHYKYVTESELSSEEKNQLVYDIPTYVENDDETYYLVYKLNSQNQLAELPNTGSKNEMQALVAGTSLAALGILIFAVSKKKVKNKTVLHLVLVAGIGNGVLISAHALENNLLLNYNTDYELTSGEKLPLPKDISGYRYVGYIKEGNITSESKVNNQEKSAATPTKQQKVDYSVTPNFVDHPKVQDIQEEKTASSTKPTEVQVVEKPLSTELTNPRKEEKQSSDSQAQLAEHKNLETKKEEKNSPKEKTGVNTLNPQDEVLSGQLNKPELLYREETIETKIDFQEEVQENPDLAEGTVRVKQEGTLGKKVEVIRIFSVNKEEVSREIVSTSTTAPVSRIVEKGTKKTQVITEQPETGVEHKDVQSGAIVEPAIQPELPAAVVTDKGEPAIQPALPEAVVTDKGEPEVQPELPEAVVTDKGEPEQVATLPEYTGLQAGAIVEPEKVEPEYAGVQAGAIVEPEQVAPLPEYTGVQAGAIVEPEQVAPLPEYTGPQAGAIVEPEQVTPLPEYTGPQAGAIVEPEQVTPLPEYTGVQAGAIVEPEKVEAPKEYTGVQAGAIVEPEKVEAPKEYTGKIEQPSAEDTKPENEASPTNGEAERPKDKIKEEKEVDKKLELRNISNVELYTLENDKYRHVTSLASVPTNPTNYFMKVKSENFKDVMLPVKSIESATKDNQDVYKIVGQANDLIQHENDSTVENYTYYLPKTINSKNEVYTSFKHLVEAMNRNLHGTFRLGATMDAREVELSDGQESYINQEFSGTLIGTNNDKNYAIYNLKKPLFNALSRATIQDLSIKEANVSSKEDAATISKEAKNGTTIANVHSSGVIAGERSIGGLVSQVTNSIISESSFTGRITNTYDTKATYQIGGLVGKLSGVSALIDRSISSIDMATNANTGDQVVGGIAGVVDKNATIRNSYVEGNLNNVKHFGYVGGVAGYLWDRESSDERNSGQLTNVLSDVNVTNGNAIAGYDFKGIRATNTYSNQNNKVVNVVQVDDEILSRDSEIQRGTVLENNKVLEKKAELVPKKNTKIEDFNFSSRYETDYKNLKDADVNRLRVYKNIEKLLPFYNRETIVKYGNLVDTNNDLFTKEVVSVVPMKDKEVITDINKHKASINKLLLYYSDNTSQTLDVKYQQDFSKVAEYEIANTKLIYTPNTLLHNYDNIVKTVLNDLKSVQYDSGAVRKVLDISSNIKLTELYLDEQFEKTKEAIGDSLAKLLSADAAIAENSNSIIDNYVIEKIKNNKEALLLGLTYLERWYNFKYGDTKAKDLVMYHLDFFGKSNSSALDNVIELGKSGYNNLLAKNNVITYNVLLAKNYKTNNLFDALEKYRKAFVPDKTNNEWFKEQTKAYIVEEKSAIKEVSDKQSIAGSPYSIGVYDRLTSPSWKYPSMVLPLLTLPEKSVFIIANISTIGFGAYDRYRSKEHPAGTNLNDYVETKAREAAARFRDHYDYWYKILDNENKEKLYRSVLVYDAFRFGTDDKGEKDTYQATFETNHPAIKHFFGPAGNNVVHNSNGAYATGDAFYYMAYRMLDKDGAVTYTHEMTHNSDREIYLGGYGRRNGLGPEFYAKGLLQAPDHPNDPTITINSILKYEESEDPTRLQVKDPTKRFNNAEDLQKYMHNMFDVIYMLEYLEGNAVVNLDISKKNELLRKIENKFEPDPDGSKVYATNTIRYLNESELSKLTTFNSLIENDVITRRGYENDNDNTFKRNGYYTIKLFSPIYSALSNNEGTPGDLMGRRMAFELLAAKGFKDGMVPYISNQYAEEAKAKGKVIKSYGKEVGNVTDELVLQKIFNNSYSSWVDFKKAMYEERKAKFNKLMSISFDNPNGNWFRKDRVTIKNIEELQSMITAAVKADAEDERVNIYPEYSRVLKLKKAIFKAYLDQTGDFRSSIFENKK
ncbi:ZmpA/ZmpB/ZmpC family metallo-endopeptidase [Streptococcus sp. 596553]|uniref:ZmpA/ZmpB/ZmpC family metallo-endopeptidase n=1 Tax=Streptococcus sp. 596553 TaxID=2250596 RepID=UPI000DD5C05B|nr:ZmpA/ZmpB/ZmpC family metallo-endopeptidase [Streptococcus sp. 596553]